MFACPRNEARSIAAKPFESGERTLEQRKSAIGSATLVGAGPNHPDLLTLRAVKAIQRADAELIGAVVAMSRVIQKAVLLAA